MQFSAVLFMMQFKKTTSVPVKNPKELIAKMFFVIVELQHLSIIAFLYCSYPKCYTLCYTLTIVFNYKFKISNLTKLFNFMKVAFISSVDVVK